MITSERTSVFPSTPLDAAEDVGNIIALEHVNTTIPDQGMATVFYLSGMGFTRDPYVLVGSSAMWVNVGEEQFHLPTRVAQTLPGHVGVLVPSLEALARRLQSIGPSLSGTVFTFSVKADYIEATSP